MSKSVVVTHHANGLRFDRRSFLWLLAGAYAANRLGLPAAVGQLRPRELSELDFNWKFKLGNPAGAQEISFDDRDWRKVDLPHDWSIEGRYDESNPGGALTGYLPTGIGWYRRGLEIPVEWSGKQISVCFDAVFMNSTVWINGHELGTRPYGYISFAYDLTPYVKPGRNILAVRVNNEKQPAARWYTGSGIYSHVRLLATAPIHVAQWGVFIRTTDLTQGSATLTATMEIRNETAAHASITLRAQILAPSGNVVAQSQVPLDVAPRDTTSTTQRLVVANPEPWSPDSPTLYALKLQVTLGDDVIDQYQLPFGIRTAEFQAERGLMLNGSSVKLRGVADHHCAMGVGVAIPDALLEWQLRLLKKMGVNAIRTAHHPRPPVFYDLCDQLGLLVMDELFDGWYKKAAQDYGARFFAQWWQQDAADCVKRDRNHPSVVIWSIGNETGATDNLGIAKLIHSLDDTRPVTGGQVLNGVDVAGFNGPGGTPGTLEAFHAAHPDRPIVLTEEPHTLQTRGFYRVATWWRDKDAPRYDFPAYGADPVFYDGNTWYNSSYDNAGVRMTVRTSCQRTESWPWLAGEFRWTGFDYLGEAGFELDNWPARMWNYGVIDLAGIPKDAFYLYQAFWTKEPMVHLLPHWTHPGMNGVVIPVVAYSNAQEVELFLNDKSIGRNKPQPLGDFVWKVPYEPGEIKAIAYTDEKSVASTLFHTAAAPCRIRLETDNADLRPDRSGLAVTTFVLTDAADVMVPWAMNRVDLKVVGPVRLLGYENGDPLDITEPGASYRRAFYGMGRGFFQGMPEDGAVELIALGVLGDTLFPASTEVAIAMNRIALRGTLSPASFEIRYTVDSSEPTSSSPLYTQPLILTQATRVRALLLRDGQAFLTTVEDFQKGEKPRVTDPRWEKKPSSHSPFTGPLAARLVGRWRFEGTTYEIRPDGTLLTRSGREEKIAGWWWYAMPLDPFESSGDYGHGELRFVGANETLKIELTGTDGQRMTLKSPAGTFKWSRLSDLAF